MKKTVLVSIAIIMALTFAGISISFAETKSGDSIFAYKNELSMTDKQEKNLRDIITKLQNFLTTKQKELDVLRADLSKMLTDRVDLSKIKAKVNEIAKIQADATYEDLASTRAIEEVLTSSQLSKWRGMQVEFAKKALQAQQAAAKKNK